MRRIRKIDLLTGSTMSGATKMTGTTTVSSAALLVERTDTFSIQAVWTGTPTGAFKLQGSNDVGTTDDGAGVTNWTDIAGSSSSVSGAAGNQLWTVGLCGYRWVQLVYTNASGTGTVAGIRAVTKDWN